jgi:hypothetical protein
MFRILSAVLFFCMSNACMAVTLDDIAKKSSQHAARISCPYQVSIQTVISVAQHTVKDSGKIEFTPPDCFHIVLSNGKVDQSGCGDTTWITGPDGSITRKIGENFASQYKSPDISEMLKKQNAHIISDTGNMVVVEITMPDENMPAKAQFFVDTTEWLIRKSLIIPPTGMPIESGYAYEKFQGKPVISQISTVMGASGFVKISFRNYSRIKAIPRSKFKKL